MSSIVIAVDGVLANTLGHSLAMLHGAGGPRLWSTDLAPGTTLEDFVGPDWWPVFENTRRMRGFCSSIETYSGAVGGPATLRACGHHVRCVSTTALSRWWLHERREWLMGIGEDPASAVFTGDVLAVVGDVLVTSEPSEARAWTGAGRGLAALWDRPWNAGVPWPRVASWSALVRLMQIAKGPPA